MVIDFDLQTGLPPWDMAIMRNGVRIAVRHPTGIELARILDLNGRLPSECRAILVDVFAALTGMARDEAETLDPEELATFYKVMGDVLAKRLQMKSEMRQRQSTPYLLPAAQRPMN